MPAARLRRTGLLVSIATLPAAIGFGQAMAQPAFPTKPVRLIVPFPPGGGADIVARLLAPQLQTALGQTVFVENRGGAAGRLGTGVVAQSEPDGHTLLVATESSLVIAPHMGVTMNYEPLKDFAAVSLLTRNTVMLVVHPSAPVKTLADYIAMARANPGRVFYASSGVGGPNHLAGEIFKQKTGLEIVHVPFQGTGAAVQAVIANQVPAMWGFTAGLLQYIEGGTLKAIAVGGRERSAGLPNVPTVIEGGVADYDATSWIGMVAPAAIDKAVLAKLSQTVVTAMKSREVRDIMERDGSEVVASSAADFRRAIEDDYAKYSKMSGLFKQAQQTKP
jgi:tripartite-type tricarboxylate transporter receptor subunit TctC